MPSRPNSIPRPCIALARNCNPKWLCIEFSRESPEFLLRFTHTFCPEEMFFQSLLLNSLLKHDVVNDNLRYIDWEWRNGTFPANLDESDYEKLIASGKLFGRKLEFPVGVKLLQKIDIFRLR